MFTRINSENSEMLTIRFEGQDMQVRSGLTVAAALLENSVRHFRETPVSSTPRAPFCMMGVCFDCLVVIDGTENQQACMTHVVEGMQIERQMGPPDFHRDIVKAAK